MLKDAILYLHEGYRPQSRGGETLTEITAHLLF